MKQPVTQNNEMGCGAACAAFVASVSYAKMMEVLSVQAG